MAELLGLPYSPWSEKARWALDARKVPYRFRYYQPLIGEPSLRAKLKRWSGRVSVPVLTDDDGRALADSLAIARWANGRGDGPDLFPQDLDARITAWVERSERAMDHGRALALRRMLEDGPALDEMVPPAMRRLGKAARAIAKMGVKRTLRKYDGHNGDDRSHREAFAGFLEEIREALARQPGAHAEKTLLGRFTFADIAAAQAIAFVEPPPSGLKIGAGSRRAFSDPELKTRFADVLAWRDALYAARRGAPAIATANPITTRP